MGYELRWGKSTWIYALALGFGLGMPIILIFWEMLGQKAFWNYYSPMLGYYVLISICQSHYFRRKPEPDMSGLFRQFVSIFGAVFIFFLNQTIMINVFGVPSEPAGALLHGGIIMSGHFTFIVFGFFIYGFDDFMFKGKLVGWMKKGVVKTVFWYLFIWLLWYLLFYMKGGVGQAYSTAAWDAADMDRVLAISQWIIIISLLYALVFRDWLPDLQKRLHLKNDYLYGLFLLAAAAGLGAGISYLLFAVVPYIAPWEHELTFGEKWHHILYMGTYPLIPAILMGVYTPNFSWVKTSGKRVLMRVALLIPSIILAYFAFHLIIAEPELIPNYFFPGLLSEGMGIFHREGGWYHQLGLYFNFTVSIIPLTHHWFCGKAGFMKEI